MQAKEDSFPHSNQEKNLSFDLKMLYRAYDLILSWPLPETAVSDEQEASKPNTPKSPEITQQKKDCQLI